jgi:hypothetical protein
VQRVLQNLSRERAAPPITRNTVLLTEYGQQAIRRHVVKPLLEPSGDLSAYFLDPIVEQSIESAVEYMENSSGQRPCS